MGGSSLNQGYEAPFLKILSNMGYGDTDLKKLLKEGYITNNHVYSIINRIAEDAASIPVVIENKLSDGTVEVIEEGDFYNFVHNPNVDNNYKSFTYQSIVYQLTTGNEVQYGIQGIGSKHFAERWNLAPQYITPKVNKTIVGPRASSYKYNYDGTDYPLAVEEVMHLKKFNPDPADENAVMGLSPLQAAYKVLVASNEIITADASIIKNKGAIGMLSAKGGKDGRPLTETQAKDVDSSLKKRIGGGGNYGSVKVTTGSFDFIKFAMSPQDLQLLESGVLKLRDLCSIYGVSSRIFNDPNGATFNNTKEDNKKYYQNGVLPPLENDIDYFNRFFVPGWSERDNTNYSVRLDKSKIEALQADQKVEAEKDKILMDGINVVLNMPISAEGKQVLLVDTYGMTEEDASLITNIETNEEQ